VTKKPRKASDTKRKIFEAALRIFSEKGYAGATMDDVISVAGVSKGSIYWHFKSKRELFIELLDFWFEGLIGQLEAIFRGGGSAIERIHRCAEISMNITTEDDLFLRAFMEFFNVGLKDPKFRENLKRNYKKMTDLTAEVIREGIASGEFGVSDAERNAVAIIAYLDGFMMRLMLEQELATEENSRFMRRFIERALICRPQKESR